MSDDADNAQREIERMDQRISIVAQSSHVVHDKDFEHRRNTTHRTNCGDQISAARKAAFAHAIRCTACETDMETIRKGR